jgi:hypothetical protein
VNDYWTTSEVYKSTDAGSTFPTKITNFNTHPVYLRLAVTPANPSLLGILCQNQNSYGVGPHQVFMYNNSNNTLTQKASVTIGGADIFFISPSNANILYAGNTAVLRSDDGGNTWNAKTAATLGTSLPQIHVDQHFVASNPLDAGYTYFCNDGGLWKGRESDNTWTNLSNGLLITQFYRIANSQSNVKRLIGGTQDNGGRKRLNDGSWAPTSGGDACEVAVDQSNDNIIYSSYPGGTIYRSTDYWTTDVDYNITNNISPVPSGDWVTPFALDPSNNATIVAGFDDVYRSTNRGTNWIKISTGLTTDPNIKLRTIAVAPSNSNVIYASYNNTLCKTSNLGGTWTKSTVQVSSGVTSGNNITSIAVSYSDPNKVYVTVSGYTSGDKVYIYNNTTNTWTNISGTLPNVPVNCIILQKNTTQDLYIGTDAGVYYRSTSATDWTHYGTGLPNTQVSDLEIYYAGSALRAGTFGRGIWETTLSTPGNTPPSITLSISPTSYTAPANITLSATATDSDGTISKVEFYRGGTTLIGTSTSTSSPYKFSWTGVAAGTYSVTAKAYDNLGATTISSVVTVTVTNSTNNPPSVSLNISPTSYTAPANITLSAPATDTDGTISKVEFYRGGTTLIGTSSSTVSPYTFSWTGVAAGTYSVTAKAYDNLGATTTSSAVSVTVNPSTTCTAPVWNATTVYTAGNLVQYSGIKYQAAFWTQNQRPDLNNGPSGSGQPWISLGTCTSKIASLAETMQDVLVAPNPVDVNLSINFNLIEANEVDIYIIDQLGKRVQNVYQGSMAEGDYHYDVNTSSLVPGIYSVVLQGVNGEKLIRFVKK